VPRLTTAVAMSTQSQNKIKFVRSANASPLPLVSTAVYFVDRRGRAYNVFVPILPRYMVGEETQHDRQVLAERWWAGPGDYVLYVTAYLEARARRVEWIRSSKHVSRVHVYEFFRHEDRPI